MILLTHLPAVRRLQADRDWLAADRDRWRDQAIAAQREASAARQDRAVAESRVVELTADVMRLEAVLDAGAVRDARTGRFMRGAAMRPTPSP